ncbi:MAG: hypothetical protein KDK75_19055 [Alphaproteobacteria bacterium]|nr:hypothetical protein [Alphaproteobacteria bacterium]
MQREKAALMEQTGEDFTEEMGAHGVNICAGGLLDDDGATALHRILCDARDRHRDLLWREQKAIGGSLAGHRIDRSVLDQDRGGVFHAGGAAATQFRKFH